MAVGRGGVAIGGGVVDGVVSDDGGGVHSVSHSVVGRGSVVHGVGRHSTESGEGDLTGHQGDKSNQSKDLKSQVSYQSKYNFK